MTQPRPSAWVLSCRLAPSPDPTRAAPARVPRLRHRPLALPDIQECVGLLPPRLGMDARQAQDVAAHWAELVDEPSFNFGVVEDVALPAGARIQATGATLFVPPQWARQLAQAPRPHVTHRIYQGLRDGSLRPMGDRELGAANAAGELVLVVLHYGQSSYDMADPYVTSLLGAANENFRLFHAGYQVQAVHYETDVAAASFVASAGFLPRTYADGGSADPSLPPHLQLTLFGLTREQALSSPPGSTARNMFERHVPLFRFSAAQRRLLWLSLFDEGDDALQAKLGVSVHGLKKLWRGIHERIDERMPELFGEESGGDDGKRGPEKRRQVLAYVRQRLEELQPWNAALRLRAPAPGRSAALEPGLICV